MPILPLDCLEPGDRFILGTQLADTNPLKFTFGGEFNGKIACKSDDGDHWYFLGCEIVRKID